MSRKVLSIALMLAMTLSMLIPISSVSGQGIPNPDHVYYVTHGGIETCDPAWAYDTASGELIQNILEPLCAFDGKSTEAFIAKLADWWPGYGVNTGNAITPSPPDPNAPAGTNQTWYFRIRTGVKWQDPAYGELTPYDVEYSIERGMMMDHSGGPQWMLYEPLLGGYSSMDYDADDSGVLEESEYLALESDVKAAVEANSTHVWFNLPAPYGPFQQILSQSWAMVLCKQYAIDHGCWTQDYGNYAEFQRIYDPPSPGPLMTPDVEIMGTGPYKLAAINTDPHVGWWTVEKFDDYWGGWASPGHVTYATVKLVEEWANRKAQFFSTDPALQADFCVVPRANCAEMHVGGDKDAAVLPGFRLLKYPVEVVGALFFTYNVSLPSDYAPRLGADIKTDLFSDRDLRLGFIYSFNHTRYLQEYWLGEAITPTTCMPPGTAYYNASKPIRHIDLALAEQHFKAAWGGEVWSKGMTVKLTYNEGNTARETICKILEDVIEHRINWPAGVSVDIQPTGVPWGPYITNLVTHKLGAYTLGWMADFPHPHNWFFPFMHSYGDYTWCSSVVYGLGDITASWPPGPSYGPPPYTNALGESVTAINNTYVDHLITTALAEVPAMQEKIYNELMDIYYAEASQMPAYTSFARHYERTWINGYAGTWNENPICPGYYFYTIWKEATAPVYSVDISAKDTIANSTTAYPLIQVYHGEMRLEGDPAKINYTIHVSYVSGDVDVWVYIGLRRMNETGYYYFPLDYYISLGPGEDYTETFTWYEEDTMEEGNWTISLYVSPSGVPGGEVEDPDLTNNIADHPQIVEAKVFVEDLNGDGKADMRDISTAAKAFGSYPGHDRWDPLADIDGNEKVDMKDVGRIAKAFGKTLFTI